MSGHTEHPASTALRPKRNQVGRACDWCRANRIKCDDSQPCKNCQIRGCDCVTRRKDARNLPSANRELGKLRVRVAELESQLRNGRNAQSMAQKPSDSLLDRSLKTDDIASHQSKRWHWEGIWTAESHTGQAQYYGPTSVFYFIDEIRKHLKKVLKREHLEFSSLPSTASKIFESPTSSSRVDDHAENSNLDEERVPREDMTRTQEEYFLNMFWQLYHCTIPILDHGTFKEHYDLLWAPSQSGTLRRKPSALVDIVLALCIQYGTASIPHGRAGYDTETEDSSIGGRWIYHRCQMLLSREKERPSLSTLQCYVYSAVYLWNASFFNMAHETLAIAIRAAYTLGLHRKSNDHLSDAERQLSGRIWCTLFCLDVKACIDLGRPFSIHLSDVTCEMPADYEATSIPASRPLLTHQDLSYLEYHSQFVKLLMLAQTIHIMFDRNCTELISVIKGKSPHEDPDAHESAAKVLEESITTLQEWAVNVPELLKMKRKGGVESFSISRSAVDIDTSIPLWMQRQRLFLELLYHNIMMTLYRPFIQSSSSPMSLTPVADSCRHKCLHHAIITTNIIGQYLSETTLLNGIYEVCQYQWEAVISMLGFALFRPICPFAVFTSNAIHTGLTNLEIFGTNNFATALSAANTARTTNEYIDLYSRGFQVSLLKSSRTPSSSVETPREDMPIDTLVKASNNMPLHYQGNSPLSLANSNALAISTAVFPHHQNTPVTAEEFAARMAANMHSNDTSWLLDQDIDPGLMDINMGMWADWMNDH